MSETESSGVRPHLVVVDRIDLEGDVVALEADVAARINAHNSVDGVPHVGDQDYDDYARLFNDVTHALRPSLKEGTVLLFSRRKALVDALWRMGYRQVPEKISG